jgi:hypothetical protein
MHTPAPAEPEYDPAGHAAQEEPPAGEPSKGRSQARMQQRAQRWRGRMKCVNGEISRRDAHSGEESRRGEARQHRAASGVQVIRSGLRYIWQGTWPTKTREAGEGDTEQLSEQGEGTAARPRGARRLMHSPSRD